ncbi:hypothetical protein PLICRDRAFT_176338 [Plicaturopsis crispa FD-325 SS-3]|nr:hypothetical protein PLICRDRAFT_176338 [Plicaturopsis crispa FD-325 SS-3]
MPAIVDKIADALHLHKGAETTTVKAPVFDSSKVTVIFVLGGPGAGKGTQCSRLVSTFNFCHLSAGDLLRAEQTREGSTLGRMIQTHIREGTIVPMEVTVKLLENAMSAAIAEHEHVEGTPKEGWGAGRGRFLIDGFPRKMDQAEKFEEEVCVSSLVLYFSTTQEVMLERILERAKTSGREDDNIESMKKRFNTYKEQTMPVIEYYTKIGKVAELDSSPPVDEVHAKTAAVMQKLFQGQLAGNVSV